VSRTVAGTFVIHVTVIAGVMLAKRVRSLCDRIRQTVENGVHEISHCFIVALATAYIFGMQAMLTDVFVAKPFFVMMVHFRGTVVFIAAFVDAMHVRAGRGVPLCLLLINDVPIVPR
jgi:hypothetical protein